MLLSSDTQRLRPGETVTSLHGAAIVHRGDGLLLEDLAPGFYALGYRLATDGEGERVQLEALDGCGTLWKVDSSAGPAEFYIETVRVHRRCPSLELSQSGNGRRDVEQFFLASLPTPHVSLWAADDVPRWLDVSVSETGVVPGMYDTQ
jgi:hypothetical protein